MNETNTPPKNSKNILGLVIAVLALLLLAGLFGWRLGRSQKQPGINQDSKSLSSENNSSSTATDVNAIIAYTMPDGWKDGSCPGQTGTVFVVPNGSSLQCGTSSIAPIRIVIDPQNTTDCQQLNTVQNVRKHVCKSLYIDGHKSLQASTEFPKSSNYPDDTTISDYYIDTGKGVAKVEYMYTSSNNYQLGFDQLANSIHIKN